MRLPLRRPSKAPLLVLLLLVAACAGKPQRPQAGLPPVKIGKPYQVQGVWYTPRDDRDYDQRGIASWYGPGFHALSTANGERYDQDGVTAAHKTLPMPSWVEVENLDNGRRLVVRINDRGPFVAGRIIDLSRRSAQLLGVDKTGLAKVRVRRVFPDMDRMPVIAASAPPALPVPEPAVPVPAVPVPVVAVQAVPASVLPAAASLFIQVAALSDPGRIAWLTGYLGSFGPVVTAPSPAGLTRVRLGPYAEAATANAVLAQLQAAGYTEARLIPGLP